MAKKLFYVLPALLMSACGETPERYRDTHFLELPPELPIEHTHQQPAVGSDDLNPKASPLASLIAFEEANGTPVLTLKTRPERAWEMVGTALHISNINTLDKNRELSLFHIRYDADSRGEQMSLLGSLWNDNYAEADYTITLKEDLTGVKVNVALTKPDDLEYGEDGSNEVVRVLYKVINDKIINRNDSKPKED